MTERTYTPDEWAYISERGLTPGDDIEEALFQRRERDRVSTRPLTAGEIAIPTAQGVKRLIEHITDVSIQIALENEKIGAPRYLAGLKADLACSWFEMESMLSKWELKETSDWRWMNEHGTTKGWRVMSEMDVRQYRKKPVRIEAARYVGTPLNTSNTPFPRFQKLVDWCGGRIVYTEEVFQFYPTIAIDTLEGTMQASWGDWIIRGVNGEFYPCKDEIFRKTYDPVHMLPDNEGE